MAKNITEKRLDDEISWYSKKSKTNQISFKISQIVQLLAAAAIPILAAYGKKEWTIFLGIAIVVANGVQNLFQFQEHWISYRSTAESLKHEKYLWLAGAGPYSSTKSPRKLLAERIESLISQEHAKWIVDKEKIKKNEQQTHQ